MFETIIERTPEELYNKNGLYLISNMDENFRKQRVEIFFLNIEISYVKSSSSFSEYLGVNVVWIVKASWVRRKGQYMQ